ncbi:hypothetical protein PYW07_000319 [Mythimna separata]|uniref:BPTI/Kunitz inhibitor domain-containing protein n=1 Tax=Mythimna separata TaxID=271217 RepID=A0AAD8E0C0_MYTSE|nr:hypothetical protein PYW07_000319 [Mythimna separata]
MDITSFDANIYCKFQANQYKCGKTVQFSYYYDTEKNTCQPFDYGYCLHPYNVYPTLHACTDDCRDMNHYRTQSNLTANIFCRLQPEFGSCNSYHPRFYYDMVEMTCKGFSYSGCGGNQNRFDQATLCMDTCMDFVKPCSEKECFH